MHCLWISKYESAESQRLWIDVTDLQSSTDKLWQCVSCSSWGFKITFAQPVALAGCELPPAILHSPCGKAASPMAETKVAMPCHAMPCHVMQPGSC